MQISFVCCCVEKIQNLNLSHSSQNALGIGSDLIHTPMSTTLGAINDEVHFMAIADFTPENERGIAFFHLWYRAQK